MQSEFSKDLEEHIISRYTSIRHKFEGALRDQNEYKNLPQISFGLLTLLNNVRNAKPHAEYLIQSLESTDLKLRAINFLLKTQNEIKGKESAKLSIKSTLNGDEYFKDKIERMKAKTPGAANAAFKKPNMLGGTAPSEPQQESSFARSKPIIRSYKEVEEESGGNAEFQFANKKNKLTTNEDGGYFKSTSSFEPAMNKFENTETSAAPSNDMPGFMSAKDQFVKNQEQKKKFGNDNGNGYSNQNSYYNRNKGGYNNNNNNRYSKYNSEDGDNGSYGGYNKGRQPYYNQNRGKGYGKYGGDEMEEEVSGGYGNNRNQYKPYNKFNNNFESTENNNSGILEKVHFSAFRKNINTSTDTTKNEDNNSSTNTGTGSGLGSGLGQSKGLGLRKKFVPPLKENQNQGGGSASLGKQNSSDANDKLQDERYKGLDPKLVEMIENDIVDRSPKISWKDIAGLQFAKKTIYEIIVWPMMRPDIFNGLRAPPKGLLLFGPPGTGKTMIGKAIASESNSTFFSISASSLTSKWVGEGEKMVKTLFAIAAIKQPAVIFIDEIDSLLSARSDKEDESSRRIKTEFLVQLDGARTTGEERILIIGATNRPAELDEAVKRRFQKRLYIPLPNSEARRELIKVIIEKDSSKGNKYSLSPEEIEQVVDLTKGYSGADMRGLCAEAAMVPLRNIHDISEINSESLRAIILEDFMTALKQVKATVSNKDLGGYLEWNRSYGSFDFKEEDLEN